VTNTREGTGFVSGLCLLPRLATIFIYICRLILMRANCSSGLLHHNIACAGVCIAHYTKQHLKQNP
jgi:hypothetical protein